MYDEWNRPWSVALEDQPLLGDDTNRGVWFDNEGNLYRLEYGSGPVMTVTRAYDQRGRVSHIDARPHLILEYTHDGEGNVESIYSGTNLDIFSYDDMDRLTSFTRNQVNTTTYGYDARGNRIYQNENHWTYNEANVLTAVNGNPHSVSTDNRGNMTKRPHAGGELILEYDDADRLTRVIQNGTPVLENTYDAFGNRVHKIEGNRETIYLYHGNNIVYEWEGDTTDGANPQETRHVFVGNLRVAQVVDGAVQYIIADHLGSTRVITDDAGNLLHFIDYRPFGEELTSSGTDGAKFTGKTEDGIGLYYYGARFYDPTLGRFLTIDPARDGLNWYVYVANNPLKYVDPDGRVLIPAKSLNKKDLNDLEITLEYIASTKFGKELIQMLSDSDHVFTIYVDRTIKRSSFHEGVSCVWGYCWGGSHGSTIHWNPEQGLELKDGSIVSPAALLGHELGHATHFLDGRFIPNLRGFKPYIALIENQIVRDFEIPLFSALGEPTRNKYSDYKHAVRVSGPLSRESLGIWTFKKLSPVPEED